MVVVRSKSPRTPLLKKKRKEKNFDLKCAKLQAVFRHMSIECDRGCEGDEDDDDSDSDETTSSATSSEDFDNSEGDNSSWAPGEDFQTNSTEFSIFTEEGRFHVEFQYSSKTIQKNI